MEYQQWEPVVDSSDLQWKYNNKLTEYIIMKHHHMLITRQLKIKLNCGQSTSICFSKTMKRVFNFTLIWNLRLINTETKIQCSFHNHDDLSK